MKKLLQSSLFAVLLGGFLFFGVTFWMLDGEISNSSPGVRAAIEKIQKKNTSEDPEQGSSIDAPSWAYDNPEWDQIYTEIVYLRSDLKERAAKVKKQEDNLKVTFAELKKMTNLVNKSIITISENEKKNIAKMQALFKTLEPAQTAEILDPKSPEEVAKVFAMMKPSEFGEVVQVWLGGTPDQKKKVMKILDEYEKINPEK
ncbi:MAG: hypothetical protein P8L18_09375 [Verrucomicrobiota bacterium]|nr:hypothetical protein [Verrucomicrobiota bacterium]